MAYWTKGETGRLTSWGSANLNATILSNISPARCTLFVGSDTPDVTAFQAYAAAKIPGLKRWNISVSAYAGSTPFLGNAGTLAYSAGGYALHVPSWTWTGGCDAILDMTEFNPSVVWRNFAPSIWNANAQYTAGIDSATSLALPPSPGAALPTLTLTYGSGATLAASSIISSMNANIAVRNKNTAAYQTVGSGNWTAVGGIFGSYVFGNNGANADPLWSAGGSATGAIVMQAASGRTYTGADSFMTRCQITCEVGSPVRVDIDIQGMGALTVA